jgi:hypothetical protein
MATTTVNGLPQIASPVSADKVSAWDTSAGTAGYIEVGDLNGGTLTGDGTIATGGYTLTVPATGTAALRDVANTFTATQTFNRADANEVRADSAAGLDLADDGGNVAAKILDGGYFIAPDRVYHDEARRFSSGTVKSVSVSTTATEVIAPGSRCVLALVFGDAGSGVRFADLVTYFSFGTTTDFVMSSNEQNAPAARTYSVSNQSLLLTMASGTYNVGTLTLARIGDA